MGKYILGANQVPDTSSVYELLFAGALLEIEAKFMIGLLGEFVKKVEYQALDSDIQRTILQRLHVCKMDIQSACRGKIPYNVVNLSRTCPFLHRKNNF
ncbi:MAG: hypothetical protein K1W16_14590 [Lachnospiraceae bacterium]